MTNIAMYYNMIITRHERELNGGIEGNRVLIQSNERDQTFK